MDKKEEKEGTVFHNGKKYYSVKKAAELSKRSELSIRLLLHKGNRLGLLPHIKVNSTVLIPTEQFHKFPFTTVGRSSVVNYYDEYGNETIDTII